MSEFDCDYAIIGSGFGGSVSALRLAEKGHRVVVLEQGRRIDAEKIKAGWKSPRKFIWIPALGLRGYFTQLFFRHVGIIAGIGVGGGSLVYAATLLKPKGAFYRHPAWSGLGLDWEKELAPHYETAQRMLGAVPNPRLTLQDEYLKRTAEAMGAGETFAPITTGVYFGPSGEAQPDPFFNGEGPQREGCRFCGACVGACPHGSKNSLDYNYLYLAEKLGAEIRPLHQTTKITPLDGGGYEIDVRHPWKRSVRYAPLRARNVVVSAGVIGTLNLLFRCRDIHRTLPNLSPTLGRRVRTNSEAIVWGMSKDPNVDFSDGTTISSDFYPDENTHITQNRLCEAYEYSRWQIGPMVDEARPLLRAMKTLGMFLLQPLRSTASMRGRNWHKRITALTVMQHLDNEIRMRLKRSLLPPFGKKLQSELAEGQRTPTYLPIANRAARRYAEAANAIPLSSLPESLFNLSITAHILGGCCMGKSAEDGVVGVDHQAHGYPGLYIVDGSSISANVGVNPSLTITAMAERCMSGVAPKE